MICGNPLRFGEPGLVPFELYFWLLGHSSHLLGMQILQDSEQPGLAIGALLELMEMAPGRKKGFLDQVLGSRLFSLKV